MSSRRKKVFNHPLWLRFFFLNRFCRPQSTFSLLLAAAFLFDTSHSAWATAFNDSGEQATKADVATVALATAFDSSPESNVHPVNVPIKAKEQIDSASEAVLKKLIEIQTLCTVFRIESIRQPRLRQWRQSLYVETNSGCTMGGTADAMAMHYPNTHRPATIFEVKKKVSPSGTTSFVLTSHVAPARRIRPALSQGIQEPQVVGNCVNMAGDIFELSLNARRYLQLKKDGLGCSEYRQKILALRREVDRLLDERDALVFSLPSDVPIAAIARAEGRVLRDFRDIIMIEYSQYHSGAIKLYWFQNAAYLLDLAKNTTGATGGIINIEGAHLHRARWAGSGSLFTTISGVLILAIPVVGRVAGNWAGTVDRHTVTKDFGASFASSTDDAVRDFLELRRITRAESVGSALMSVRMHTYEGLCQMMRSHETNIERFLHQARSATRENVMYGSIVGSSKVTLGICGMLAGWHYYTKPWISSRLSAAGNTAYGSATGFSILENARILATHVIDDHKLRSEQLLPAQIYSGRLNVLAGMKENLDHAETFSK